MTTLAMSNTTQDTLVGMGQIVVAHTPMRMKAILGSCIGLAIFHPRLMTAALAHIVLPESAGRNGAPGKFADTAIPEMLKLIRELGTPTHGLVAKFAGGGNMFGGSGPLQIGDANAKAVTAALKQLGIRVAGEDVGGTKGRRIVFDSATCTLTVERAGHATQTL